MTGDELLYGKHFTDAIANGTYPVDVHFADRPGLVWRYLDGTEVIGNADGSRTRGRWRPETAENPTFYQIPYRSLVPQGATNLLVAGRAVDADEAAFGAVRVMVNCNQTGEAAGVASYLALTSDSSVADVDAHRLRETMTSSEQSSSEGHRGASVPAASGMRRISVPSGRGATNGLGLRGA